MATTVIIGRHDDPHTLAVISELQKLEQNVKCIDSFRGDHVHLHISSGQYGNATCKLVDSFGSDIKSIWLRQKPVIPYPSWSPLQHDSARFAQAEWRSVLQSLESFLPKVFWINSPERQQLINQKPKQLELAKSVGFNIPETIITNDPDAVKAFIDVNKKVIYKALAGFVFIDQTAILTTIITNRDLKNPESVKKAPGIYQKFIEKKFEARITAVGNRLFVTHILTPKKGPGSVDWRHAHFEDIFVEGFIDTSIRTCIERFQRAANLHYGAYDFIISPEGEWHFLECNPVGQFLWMENKLGQKISTAIAEDLVNCNSTF